MVVQPLARAFAVVLPFALLDDDAARPLTWDERTGGQFEQRWILPDALPIASDEGSGPDWDLVVTMEERLAQVGKPAADDPGAPRSFGDLVRAVQRAPGSVAAEIARFARTQPELHQALAPCLAELLDDSHLASPDWDPEEDHARDGICFARPLDLSRRRDEPWRGLEGSRLVQQAMTLIRADFEAIKAAENDYTRYRKRRGASYEAIHPVRGSERRGLDERGDPFAALKLFFECDLPFPFTTYSCDLRILNRTDARGRLVCDIYSTSADFLWLAGSDLFLPVRASDGAWLATLVVRRFGFDLEGVPDGDDARTAGIRSSLGALKLEAQALFAAGDGVPRTVAGRVPQFPVSGFR